MERVSARLSRTLSNQVQKKQNKNRHQVYTHSQNANENSKSGSDERHAQRSRDVFFKTRRKSPTTPACAHGGEPHALSREGLRKEGEKRAKSRPNRKASSGFGSAPFGVRERDGSAGSPRDSESPLSGVAKPRETRCESRRVSRAGPKLDGPERGIPEEF